MSPYVSPADEPFRNSTGFNDTEAMMADVNGDGNLELAVTPSTNFPEAYAYLYALSHNNPNNLPNYPSLPNFVGIMWLLDPKTGGFIAGNSGYSRDLGGPAWVNAAADLNGDGTKELLATVFDPTTAHWDVHAVEPTLGLPDYRVFDLGAATSAFAQPVVTVADVNGDGKSETLVAYDNAVHVLDSNLQELWKWNSPQGYTLDDVIVSDLANDGRIEIIATASNTNGSGETKVNVLAPQGGTIATIPPDRYEPNDTQATATNRGVVQGQLPVDNLSIHQASDVDWFKFHIAAPAGAGDDVSIAFDPSYGLLDLALTDASGHPVGAASSTGTGKSISLSGLPAGDYYATVSGHNGATNPHYTLTIDAPSIVAAADRFEPNNDLAHATNLNPVTGTDSKGQPIRGQLTGSRSYSGLSISPSGDEDYYQFQTAAAGDLTVRIDFSDVLGDIDMQLLDSNGNALASSMSTNDWEQVRLTNAAPATYYVHVYGYNGATNPSYTLSIDAPSSGAVVSNGDKFELNDTRATATDFHTVTGQTSTSDLSIDNNPTLHKANNGVDVDWFKFQTVAAGSGDNFVRIDFVGAQGVLGLDLFDASGKCLTGSQGVADFQQVGLGGLGAGTYYVEVYGVNGATNPSYKLTISAPRPPSPRSRPTATSRMTPRPRRPASGRSRRCRCSTT